MSRLSKLLCGAVLASCLGGCVTHSIKADAPPRASQGQESPISKEDMAKGVADDLLQNTITCWIWNC